MPADVNWLVHMDVDQLKSSVIGDFVMNRLTNDEADRKLAAFAAVFNFDPRQDISAVTLFGTGRAPEQGALVVAGNLDVSRLATLAAASAGYQKTEYSGADIHRWTDEKHGQSTTQYGSVLPDGRIVVSQGLDMVKRVIDAAAGRSTRFDPATRFPSLVTNIDAPFFMAGADLSGIQDASPRAAMLKQADMGCLAITESAGQLAAVMTLSVTDPQVATQLSSVAQGMIGLAMLSQSERPELARVAQSARVEVNGTLVSLRINAPAQDVVGLLQAQAERHPSRHGGAAAPVAPQD
jgi:hypothetical protein